MKTITYTEDERQQAESLLAHAAMKVNSIHSGDVAAALVMAADDMQSVSNYWALIRHLPSDADVAPVTGGSLARDYSVIARSLPEPGLAWVAINAMLSSPMYARKLPHILDLAIPNPKQRPNESIRYLLKSARLAQQNSITLPDIVNDILNLQLESSYYEGVVSVAYPQLPDELENWAQTGISMPAEYDQEIDNLMAGTIPQSAIGDVSCSSLILTLETDVRLWDSRREAYKAVLDNYWPLEGALCAHLTGFDGKLGGQRISRMGDKLAGAAATPFSLQRPKWSYGHPYDTLAARFASSLASTLIESSTRGWDYFIENTFKDDLHDYATNPKILEILKAGNISPRSEQTMKNIMSGDADFTDDVKQRIQPKHAQKHTQTR